MKYKIQRLLNQFSRWLWIKTHIVSATEMMILRETDWLEQALKEVADKALKEVVEKAREETRKDIIRDIKKYLKGKNMPVQTKDNLRNYLNNLDQKKI